MMRVLVSLYQRANSATMAWPRGPKGLFLNPIKEGRTFVFRRLWLFKATLTSIGAYTRGPMTSTQIHNLTPWVLPKKLSLPSYSVIEIECWHKCYFGQFAFEFRCFIQRSVLTALCNHPLHWHVLCQLYRESPHIISAGRIEALFAPVKMRLS